MSSRFSLCVPISDRDHVAGPEDAAATIVEYGDYECAYCVPAFALIEDILSREMRGDPFRVPSISQPAGLSESALGGRGTFW